MNILAIVIASALISPIPTPTPTSSLPKWRADQAVGEWRQIPGSALSLAPISVRTYPSLGGTGPSAKTIAWTGYTIDPTKSIVYSTANGGHGDYAGNEVNSINLMQDTPAWNEVIPSTPVSQVLPNTSHYADGKPTSRHSYYGNIFTDNKIVLLAGSRYGDGFNTPSVDALNVQSLSWTKYPNIPPEAGAQGCAYTLANKDIYVFCGWKVSKLTTTWTNVVSNSSVYGQGAATAYDSLRNRILIVGGENNERSIYDITTNKFTTVNVPITGTGLGMVYEPKIDAYFLRSGTTTYKINPVTFSVETLQTNQSIPAPTNGIWTRFLYVPALDGVVYFPTYNGNGWFLRTY